MKKALSLFLAVLMLCSCFAMSSSAVGETPSDYYFEPNGPVKADQCVVVFKPVGGTFRDEVHHYDYNLDNPYVTYGAGKYTGDLVVVPSTTTTMKGGHLISLPVVIPASSTDAFIGWEIVGYESLDVPVEGYKKGTVVAATTDFELPNNCGGHILTFQARYTGGAPAEDTMGTILGILIKVFGAIIGIMMYQGDTGAGIALMEKVLGGIL